MTKAFVYIAGPYTKPDPCDNTRKALAAGEEVLDAKMGLFPFVPHLSHFWQTVTPRDYEDWMELDFAWISKCDVLWRLPGESPGADREVELAQSLSIPICYSFEELVAWWQSQERL